MAKSLRKELIRKLVHLTGLPILAGYLFICHVWSAQAAGLILTALFLVLMEVEYVRLEMKPKIPDPFNIFRKHEKDNVVSSFFFVAAMIISFSVFDKTIASLALLFMIFGDMAAALIGIKFGRHRIFKQKTLEGFLAGLAVNVATGMLIIPDFPAIYITMALVGSTVELITGKLDDNLTVPLFAGFTGQLIAYQMQVNLASVTDPGTLLFKSLGL